MLKSNTIFLVPTGREIRKITCAELVLLITIAIFIKNTYDMYWLNITLHLVVKEPTI